MAMGTLAHMPHSMAIPFCCKAHRQIDALWEKSCRCLLPPYPQHVPFSFAEWPPYLPKFEAGEPLSQLLTSRCPAPGPDDPDVLSATLCCTNDTSTSLGEPTRLSMLHLCIQLPARGHLGKEHDTGHDTSHGELGLQGPTHLCPPPSPPHPTPPTSGSLPVKQSNCEPACQPTGTPECCSAASAIGLGFTTCGSSCVFNPSNRTGDGFVAWVWNPLERCWLQVGVDGVMHVELHVKTATIY
jgi:hypothetical protein